MCGDGKLLEDIASSGLFVFHCVVNVGTLWLDCGSRIDDGVAFRVYITRYCFGAQINIARADFEYGIDGFVFMRRAKQGVAIAAIDPFLLLVEVLPELILYNENAGHISADVW